MSGLDDAGLPPAKDGGPPASVEARLLDALPYAATIGPVGLLEERLLVRCEDAALGAFVEAFLGAAPRVAEARAVLSVVQVHGKWVAYLGSLRAMTMASREAMARALVWYFNVRALKVPSERVFVHAAVAAIDGAAVVLPGESGAGKTTLVLSLVADGWDYLSDEVAALDASDGLVHPYPRPLALEEGSWALFPDDELDWPAAVPRLVHDLRLVLPPGTGPARPAVPRAFVFPSVRPGAPTQLVELGRAEALERLTGMTFNLRERGRDGFEALAGFVRAAACFTLFLDGVADAPALLRGAMGDIGGLGVTIRSRPWI